MKHIVNGIKEELKNLAKELKELKKLKNEYDRKHYNYWGLEYVKKYNERVYSPIRIFHNGESLTITSSASITDDMIKEQNSNHKLYSECVGKLYVSRYLYRHLSIVYGHFRGRDRNIIEKKYTEVPYSYNYITKKSVMGPDPVDWAFVWELKKEYISKMEKLTNE